MRKRPIILPYNRTSISAKAVSRYFKTLRPFPNRNYKPRHNDIIVNWGFNNDIPVLRDTDTEVLNKPENIRKASSKLECLTILKECGIPVPEFATNIEDAKELFNNTNVVYCRTLTRASKGKGIVLATRPEELVKAPLYTAKLDNHIEYRVHIFNNKIIDIVQKRKMTKDRMKDKGIEQRNDDVRNLMNGWSFTRGNVTIKDEDGNYYFELIEDAGLYVADCFDAFTFEDANHKCERVQFVIKKA